MRFKILSNDILNRTLIQIFSYKQYNQEYHVSVEKRESCIKYKVDEFISNKHNLTTQQEEKKKYASKKELEGQIKNINEEIRKIKENSKLNSEEVDTYNQSKIKIQQYNTDIEKTVENIKMLTNKLDDINNIVLLGDEIIGIFSSENKKEYSQTLNDFQNKVKNIIETELNNKDTAKNNIQENIKKLEISIEPIT